ncbi:MAG: aminodeoxychorismate lyase [Pontibacterium sp.]
MQSIWINGISQSQVDVRDRGFAYGDGLFETLKVRQGKALLFERHIARLRAGALRLGFPDAGVEALVRDIQAIYLPDEAVMKLTLSRGTGGRGYAYDSSLSATRVIMLAPLPAFADEYSQGVRVRFCDLRLGLNPALAGIKHLNRLEQVIARNEWSDPSVSEGLVLDYEGFLAEGTMSNLFWCQGDRIFTPQLDRCGVEGIVRNLLIQRFSEQGYVVEQGRYRPALLQQADEVFICNSLIDVWPVRELDNTPFPLGPLARVAQQIIGQEYNA